VAKVTKTSKKRTAQRSTVTWETAPPTVERRTIIAEAYGDTGTGRTTWALTAPPPIALIHAGEKIDGVVQQSSTPTSDIQIYDFGDVFKGDEEEVATAAKQKWHLLNDAVDDALTWARTVVIDTHSDAWQLLQLANFGTLNPQSKRGQFAYVTVNSVWRSFIKQFRQQELTNLVLVGQTSAEYKKSRNATRAEATGRTIRYGQKGTLTMCDVSVRTHRELMTHTFTTVIEKGWYNALLEGLELEGDMSTFATTMSLITETDEDEWR